MTRRVWTSLALTTALLLLLGTSLVLAAATSSPPAQPAEPINTLRVYGREDENAVFPYEMPGGPFELDSLEAPPKDFVVFNPALLRDFDDDAHGMFGTFFNYFKVDGFNAHEKVHARMWYVPEYDQPAGETQPEVDPKSTTADIVLEYTYLMLDNTTLDPVHGDRVDMAFPIAGFDPDNPSDPPGLDSYDIDLNGDDDPEIMSIEDVNEPWGGNLGPYNGIAVSAKRTAGAGAGKLYEGHKITFFDYMVEVLDGPTTVERKVQLRFWYVGAGYDHDPELCGVVTLWENGLGGNPDFATVWARTGPVNKNGTPKYVDEPFWVTIDALGNDYVKLTPHRLLREDESFFVDGVEYDVAAIYTPDDAFKYITIRNPLPKGVGEVYIANMSVYKRRLPQGESIWMLPPFSYEHDMVDDINIPKWFQELDDDVRTNYCSFEDPLLPDNLDDDDDLDAVRWDSDGDRPDADDTPIFDDECEFIRWAPEPDGYGDVSFLPFEYNSILDRLVEDVGALDGENYIAWYDETDELRFDTNLMEEKFLERQQDLFLQQLDEEWQWINVETYPISYTEFILPQLPDKPTEEGYDRGDFLLVSSFMTQDSVDDQPPGSVRLKFAYDAKVSKVDSADLYVNDAAYNEVMGNGEVNSLRVYGRCDENAAFPYEDYRGPFTIVGPEAPEKDFVVFNPAYLNHTDNYFFGGIKADGDDADEKVHLRMWYVPKYLEPAGLTCPEVLTEDKVSNWDLTKMGDIVLEYTYLLLDDTTNDPTHGSAQLTKMVFPMAGSQTLDIPDKDTGDPIGLDSYDVNADGNDDIMSLEYISETLEAVVFSPQPRVGGEITLSEDEPRLEFLDFMVELEGTASQQQKADLNIYYTGTGKDAPMLVDQVTLWQGGGPVPALQGDTAALIGFRGLDDFSTGVVSTTVWTEGDFGFNGLAEPVCRPFIVYIDYVGDGEATVEVFRWLQEGETFFVDGAEYDVSKIHLVEDVVDGRYELKYFTLRNPIPKGELDLTITQLTVKKRRVAAGENLPLLPPFDREHDMVDDVNIPDTYDGVDEQYLDNDADEDEDCPDEYPPDSGLYWGCDSGIHELFNTIKERVLTDVEQLDVYWLAEEKEERFDTNLLEAKFTEINLHETWWWINIESLPWDYTEFVLPSLPDIAADYEDIDDRWKSGDYLLVSSLLTEDSDGVEHGDGAVRMKFAYDPEDGTGIYVNAAGEPCDPVTITSLTSDSPVGLGETMSFTVTVTGTGPFTYEWDFGGDGTASDEETANPTYVYDEEGTYTVVVTATNPCGEATDDLEVEVVECDPVEIDSVTSDSPVTEGSAMHFLATVTGTGPFAYEWDFGGAGTPSNASTASPTYVYDAEGQYTVVLTATNPCGVDTYELDVEVEECVAVEIVSLVSDSPVMVGSKMHFTATVTGSEPSYTWDFGGDGSGTDLDTATPTFEYDSAGNYTVSLTVENPCSDDEETLPVEVTEMELYLPIILLNHPPCYEAVTNGGFELDTGWTIPATAYLAAYSTAEAHSGSRSMRVGIEESADNVYSYSSARQTVTIPADAASATLRFYLFQFSGETWAAGAFTFPPRGLTVREAGGFFGDMQYVYILDESDQQLGDALILERSDSREWTGYEFDLAQAPYLGQTVKLAFGAYNDGCCGVTGMYVDDVSLEICYESP